MDLMLRKIKSNRVRVDTGVVNLGFYVTATTVRLWSSLVHRFIQGHELQKYKINKYQNGKYMNQELSDTERNK